MTFTRPPLALVALILGTLVSAFGDGIALLAMVLDAADKGPTWWVTEVYFAELVPPLLLAPALGAFVDRANAKKVWVAAVLLQAALFAAATLIPDFHVRVALVALANVLAVTSSSASFKLLPAVAGAAGIEKANGGLTTALSIAGLAGPAFCGAFHPIVGSSWLLGLNGTTFLVMALVVGLVIPGEIDKRVSVGGNPFGGALDGLRAMWRSPIVGPLLPIFAGVVFATSIEGVAGVFYLREVTSSDAVYGLLLSAWALGSIPGSLIGGWSRVSRHHLVMLLGGAFLVSAALLVEGLVPIAAVIGLAFLVGGFGNGVHNVGVRNVIHHNISPEMHGRAWAYYRVLVNTCLALGYMSGTPGVFVDARTAILVSALLSMVVTLLAISWFWRRRSETGVPPEARGGVQTVSRLKEPR
ncbi:MFS transporter [Streptosporangium amethystogenes subsp. fukuiense]|uniref:MFS transporter n=1 Tax=Streptosporangium amethystogenes subsp. fukuiense TaxID=698418 RepID=A0ABW2TDD4_9ACTN